MYDESNGWAANRNKNKGCGAAGATLILLAILVVVAGCAYDFNMKKVGEDGSVTTVLTCERADGSGGTVSICHDARRNVTCWLFEQGISCLPD